MLSESRLSSPSGGMTVLWCSLWFFVLLPPCVSSARLPTAPPTDPGNAVGAAFFVTFFPDWRARYGFSSRTPLRGPEKSFTSRAVIRLKPHRRRCHIQQRVVSGGGSSQLGSIKRCQRGDEGAGQILHPCPGSGPESAGSGRAGRATVRLSSRRTDPVTSLGAQRSEDFRLRRPSLHSLHLLLAGSSASV
ncbi:hypothetical protein D4764_16G0009830 [Takifugu flavidus]|uniref:Secreted protein n=1 Tax=Takifugu flavidus TaxID=433684 RepID=A0A5C6P0A9_9TELE|nr:hypothetical protein D4764_16G0009830 [Takifugu flavidus]